MHRRRPKFLELPESSLAVYAWISRDHDKVVIAKVGGEIPFSQNIFCLADCDA